MQIERIALPGIGIRYTFATEYGDKVGVICMHNGDREFFIYDRNDPHTVRATTKMDSQEARYLAELLHSNVTIDHFVDPELPATSNVARLEVKAGSHLDGYPIGKVNSRIGISVLAVIRAAEVMTSPKSDVVLRSGDLLVVAGTQAAIGKFSLAVGSELAARGMGAPTSCVAPPWS